MKPFYPGNKEDIFLQVTAGSKRKVAMQINSWTEHSFSWTMKSADNYRYIIKGLQPKEYYNIEINKISRKIRADETGSINIKQGWTNGVNRN